MKTMKHNFETKIHTMTQCTLFAAILCICSPISLPMGVVPISLALFAVMLIGILLNLKKAVISVGVYILLGICGLPVFSGAAGGLAVLFGPTGGYVWAYLPAVMIISSISNIKSDKYYLKFFRIFFACVLSIAVCYFFGTLQYLCVQKCNLQTALVICVYRFIPFDIIKALFASLIGIRIKATLKSAGFI